MNSDFPKNTNPSTNSDNNVNFQPTTSKKISIPSIDEEKTTVLIKIERLKRFAIFFVLLVVAFFAGQKSLPSRTDILLQRYRPTLSAIAAEEVKTKLFEGKKSQEVNTKSFQADKNEKVNTKSDNVEPLKAKPKIAYENPGMTLRIEIDYSKFFPESYHVQLPGSNYDAALANLNIRDLNAAEARVATLTQIALDRATDVVQNATTMQNEATAEDDGGNQSIAAQASLNVAIASKEATDEALRETENIIRINRHMFNHVMRNLAVRRGALSLSSPYIVVTQESKSIVHLLLKPFRFCIEFHFW